VSDPHENGGISVTIKGDEPGGKFNDPKSPGTWIVFHGTPAKVKEQICEVFDLDYTANHQRPLHALVLEATALFKATGNVSQSLGGTVLDPGSSAPANGAQGGSGDVWDQVAKAKSEPKEPVDELLAQIEAAKTVAEVQQIWAENQKAFEDDKYMDAYRAKGKALQAEGK
jgi:hypothetical protein